MAFSVKKQVSSFEHILIGIIRSNLLSDRAIKIYGKAAIDIIVKRTRRGFGVRQTGSNQYRFAKLSSSYIEQRKRSKLDSTTSPSKSNLTFTGQLLRSLVVTKSGKEGSFTIGPNQRRRKGGLTNESLAGLLETKNDRIFLNLAASELKTLTGLYETGLAAALKRQL